MMRLIAWGVKCRIPTPELQTPITLNSQPWSNKYNKRKIFLNYGYRKFFCQKIDFIDIAPYLGLGWDTSFGKNKGFGFLFELGAIYQGSPKVDLSADGPISSNPTFQIELAKEESNLQSDFDEFKVYPVIAIGLSYRF